PHRARTTHRRRRLLPVGAALPGATVGRGGHRPERERRVPARRDLVQLAGRRDGARLGAPAGVRPRVARAARRPARRAWRARPGVSRRGPARRLLRAPAPRADTALGRLVRTGRDAGAWLLSGLVATRRGQGPRAAALLSGALAAGADSAEARAGLAVVAARAKDWTRAAADARAALAAARGTLRHPYPREWLGDALTHF